MRCWPTASRCSSAEVPGNLQGVAGSQHYLQLIQDLRALALREADAIAAGFPKVQRRVGGYNLDRIRPGGHNMAALLVGSEGTLALFRRIKLALQPLPAHRVLGVCHFPSFYQAMASAQAIVDLGPSAVELVDRTIIELGRAIPAYPPADRPVRARHAGRAAAGRVRGRRARRAARAPRPARRADGRPRPRGRRGRGDRAGRAGAHLGRAQGRPQHRDVDEGRRASRSRSSRTARCRSSIWPSTRGG